LPFNAGFLSNNPASSCFAFILPLPRNLEPLVRAFVESDKAWAGHSSIIAADGIQMLAARGS
jgi:hypothetical protein